MNKAVTTLIGAVLAVSVMLSVRAADGKVEYRPGGKIAGEKLPLYKTKHGEPAGYPGSIKALADKADKERAAEIKANPDKKPYTSDNRPFTPQGMAPKEELYPGSVEHWSAYWFKYLPLRSMFDRQSLIKNWRATELPEAKGKIEDYAEPVYWLKRHGTAVDTGYKNPPVKVVRTKVGDPVWKLDCGVLSPGLYCLRVIGAVETKYLQQHRLPLYMRLTINDGLKGETSTYRMRFPYVDEFYSVAEFYFHAPEKRDYKATITIEDGSKVDLLVTNIDLHNALAGIEMRPIKKRRTLSADHEVKPSDISNTPELLEKEAKLWNQFPPLNSHNRYVYGMNSNDGKNNWPRVGAGGMTPKEIEEKYGKWEWRNAKGDVILVNKKLNLTYTLSDYRAGKPLPDPYPFKDKGMGVWTAPKKKGEKPQNFWPVPEGLGRRMRGYAGSIDKLTAAYRDKGNIAAGREAAFKLVRVAYNLPGIEARHSMHSTVVQPGSWGRDHGCRRRDPMRAEIRGLGLINDYDVLFDLIRSDKGLAESIGRFIPWIKTPQDVTAFLDAYLVQNEARKILRYHTYSSNTPHLILTPVNCLGDNSFTKPWMDWLFSAAFIYPLAPAGVQDLVVSANDRNGIGYIGSHMYAYGEQSAPIASYLDSYVSNGGLPQYNLGNPKLYPKPLAACYWYFDSRTAGNWFLPIGDVCGPDKVYGHSLTKRNVPQQCARGWKWSKDPKFAWGLVNYGKQGGYSDEEWAEIKKAAAKVKRAPWYENKSRVLSNWGGFLESGTEYDDDRYRRSAMVRIGSGWGHHHNDALDLQIHALGYPMTIDGGQRPGYGKPLDRLTITHNLVKVDNMEWLAHSWVNALSDVEDARYLRAEAQPRSDQVKLYSRQVALIDVDEGAATNAPIPENRKFPKDAPAPKSYVFDVQRVAGGKVHTYGFHAMLEDELVTNTENVIRHEDLKGEERTFADYFERNLPEFPQSSKVFAGTAPDVLEATWRMQRKSQSRYDRNEQNMNSGIWNPDSPRKFTKLHLFGQKGARVISTWSHCRQWKYGWSNIYIRKQSEQDMESVFTAIIEPYEGKPFITEQKLLDIADNENDALRAVAVAVKTDNGHSDLLFADGRPKKTRKVGDTTVSAEFAFVSVDDKGLRQATITGGKLLEHPLVKMVPDVAERSGTIKAVDYMKKQMTLDTEWKDAGLMVNRVFEVGVPGHRTTYTARKAGNSGGATRIDLTEGAQFYLSRVKDVNEKERIVTCGLGLAQNEKKPLAGLDKHWVASTEDGKKFWRAEYLGDKSGMGRFEFKLDGPVSAKDFAGNKGLRLWEYGVGDKVRQSSFAAIRRIADNVYEVTADTGVTITLKGQTPRKISVAELAKSGGKLEIKAGK